MTFNYRSAIGSHVGMVRSNNQDSGFAGAKLFFIADGMGGHAGGDIASSLVTKFVANGDAETFTDPEAAAADLADRLRAANEKLSETAKERPELAGLGTTFSGFFTVGDKLALAHIGDSRVYRFRNGELKQVTTDHTFVQRLVDSGQITEEEAKTHPRRSVLMRVLGNVELQPEIDTAVLETQPGDIWLLCSDGLCGYVEEKTIRNELRKGYELQLAVDQLIDRALEKGAPDNVTVALVAPAPALPAATVAGATGAPNTVATNTASATAADTATADAAGAAAPEAGKTTDETAATEAAAETVAPVLQDTLTLPTQRFVGAAGDSAEVLNPSTHRTRILGKRRRKTAPVPEAHFEPRVDEYLAELIAETKRRNWRRRATWAIAAGCGVLLITLAAFFGYRWTQTLYFVGTDADSVVIYRGVQQNIGPISLASVVEDTNIPLQDLNPHSKRQVERTLNAATLKEARDIVSRLGVIPKNE